MAVRTVEQLCASEYTIDQGISKSYTVSLEFQASSGACFFYDLSVDLWTFICNGYRRIMVSSEGVHQNESKNMYIMSLCLD